MLLAVQSKHIQVRSQQCRIRFKDRMSSTVDLTRQIQSYFNLALAFWDQPGWSCILNLWYCDNATSDHQDSRFWAFLSLALPICYTYVCATNVCVSTRIFSNGSDTNNIHWDSELKQVTPGLSDGTWLLYRRIGLFLRRFPSIGTDVVALLDEWAVHFFEELDYVHEGNNGTLFAESIRRDLPQVV